jgi:hypothetical protein
MSTITCSDLTSYARVQARNVNGTQSDATLLQAVNSAVSWVATSKFWERYKTHGEIELQEPYTTGTVTTADTDTTVILVGGTWPTWAASAKILLSGKIYRGATRTSASDLELTTAWKGTGLSAVAYTLFRDEYTLPTNCLKFGRFFPGMGWGWGGDPSSFEQVLEAQHGFSYGQKYPGCWCVHGTGDSDKIMMHPWPNTSNQLPFWYYRKPAAMTTGADIADVDPLHRELLERSIDYQVALRFETCVAGDPEKCLRRLLESFRRFSTNDKAPLNPAGPLASYRLTGPLDPRLTA